MFFLLLVISAPVFAASPLVTDDFSTVDPGEYELVFGQGIEITKLEKQGTNYYFGIIRRGLFDNIDLGIEVPYSTNPPVGIEDLILRAKYNLIKEGENDGLSIRADIKLANADSSSGLGSGYLDYGAIVIYSKAFGDFRTHYNLGYTFVGVSPIEEEANTISYSAAFEKEITSEIEAVGEYCATSTSTYSTANIQVGGRWQPTETLSFNLGYTLELKDYSNNFTTVELTAWI